MSFDIQQHIDTENADIAIQVSGLGKCYQIYDKPRDRLLQMLSRGRKQYYREFWALKDVSFTVRKGETVGIVGRNGSGKSTLLQMICGTLNPTLGGITVNGKVAALLELGAGFNPEFTGRENVYMAASLYGLSNTQVNERFDKIVAFADIGDHINQPVKSYSSGMYVRLAFAVIAHVDADILIIDEALAVGDAFFQQKCMRFLRQFQDDFGSVLFVSHDMGSVLSLCEQAVLLTSKTERNNKMYIGSAEDICRKYIEQLYADSEFECHATGGDVEVILTHDSPKLKCGNNSYNGESGPETLYSVSSFRTDAEYFGSGGGLIIDAGFFDENGSVITSVVGDQKVRFYIKTKIFRSINLPAWGFMIKNSLGEYLFTEGTDVHFRTHEMKLQKDDVVTTAFSFVMPHLIRGTYLINVAFAEGVGDAHCQHCWIHDAIKIDVIRSRLVHGYCGMNNISMSIDVSSKKE